MNREEFMQLIKSRRSVRAYKPEQIKPEELDYVLEAGTVAGHGPHAALLAQGGLYKTLWDRQQELEHFGTEEVSA